MLDELHVRGIALIEEARLEFAPSMTVLTGETGAGKTALLEALGLVSGARATAKAVRDDAEEAEVQARIISADDEEHVLCRRLTSQGRSRCTVDGQMVSVGELAEFTQDIRIHGQHEQVALLQPAVQLDYLDAWIQPDLGHLEAYRSAREDYLALAERLQRMEDDSAAAARDLEFLRFSASEIDKVDPQEGEYDQLQVDLPRLQHAEELTSALETALSDLGDDDAAADLVSQAVLSLQRLEGIDPALDEMCNRLSSLETDLADFNRDLRAYRETVEFDTDALSRTLTRLDELSGLMKRFGPTMEQVFELRERARRVLDEADGSTEELSKVREEVDRAKEKLQQAGEALTEVRQEAGERFCSELASSLVDLAMEGASFEFSFEELPFERWTADGPTRVELFYRPAPTAKLRPLSHIASGGELSRILLALECMHLSTSSDARTETLVFDEVDQGIGGATGTAVAARLSELAEVAQVIVVTHLPQVAAAADRHYVVIKEGGDESLPITDVHCVEGEERVHEIARMLAGDINDTSLTHARNLLAASDRS